jgi:hypothetical protein
MAEALEQDEEAAQAPRPVKVAFSYAWTSEQHRESVLELATRLCGDGVDVMIDAWDLDPGDDMYVFMEGLVTDDSVAHVLIVCNEEYAQKADLRGRKVSGAGTEAQIISPEVYAKAKQSKFIPVIAQTDDSGRPFVPVYLKGRIHVDLSNEQVYESEYEKLLRLIHDKPLHPRPPIGEPPNYIVEEDDTGSSTRHLQLSARRLIQSGDKRARGAIRDYLDGLVDAVGKMRTPLPGGGPFDEVLVERIGQSKVYRDEFVEIVSLLSRHWDASETWPITGTFFEDLLARCSTSLERHRPAEFEPVQFVVYELVLYYVTLLSKEHRHVPLGSLLAEQFIDAGDYGRQWPRGFDAMNFKFDQIEQARSRKSNRTSPVADLLKQRCDNRGVSFDALRQADFLLYLNAKSQHQFWRPRTIVYSDHPFSKPFPVFVAVGSPRYKALLKLFLDVEDIEGIVNFFEKHFSDPRSRTLRFSDNHIGVSIADLMNLPNLAPDRYAHNQ